MKKAALPSRRKSIKRFSLTLPSKNHTRLIIEVEVQAATARGEVLSLLRCEEHEPLLKISRLFITQDDQYIAYSKQYLRASCGILRGISGYVHKNGKNRKD